MLTTARHDVPLPSFPSASHDQRGNLLNKIPSLFESISKLPGDAAQPNSAAEDDESPAEEDPEQFEYDPHTRILPCILTNGAGHHWTGREFTVREAATLQGFEQDYEFSGTKTEQLTQIGNGVPPPVWKIFVAHIMKGVKDWKAGQVDEGANEI
jgi:site-specific DNA-cytosine methylase